ncbi:4-O-dimethylallyl-L-tyrosine synthase [Trichoderma lentiforme]|uniref:4-O-dimethylallyl-L-tyrosine synthase n=1 Tax=Trichoderma lentiforme TaxID=1567552 RepID=A0A9P5C9Q6_9HYPO|nr:4-O-dimethylallyl-L-tyrosine synthase [Trichoderma lentiforme]
MRATFFWWVPSFSKCFQTLRHPKESTHQTEGTRAWRDVDLLYHGDFDKHEVFWWQRSGYALAVFLQHSFYSYKGQLKILDFFARFIIPWMGVVDESGSEQWKSFMTDDHNPVELSWDWSLTRKPPTMRLSFEPIGVLAGTYKDPHNSYSAAEFQRALLKRPHNYQMQLFYHFDDYFNFGVSIPSDRGHQSKIFWAFNLDENDIAAKVYFTPRYKAMETGKTNLEVITEAIKAFPQYAEQDLSALSLFQAYVDEQKKSPLEVEALAIDLVDPSQSRLKIYFRSRETSFQSLRSIMTLGGRLINKDVKDIAQKGLENLRRLWDGVFEQHGATDEESLANSTHETAGILYYVDFKPGNKVPKVKVYLPVRHYAKSDWQVMVALKEYMSTAISESQGPEYLSANDSPTSFCEAMKAMFGEDALQNSTGKQTYLSCSIQQGGMLRVTSYLNPRIRDSLVSPTAKKEY